MPQIYWLDDYERSARLLPGLIVLAPVAVSLVGLGISLVSWTASLGGAAHVVAGPVLLARHVGNKGRALQEQLFRSWGGPPTTRLLTTERDRPVVDQRRRNVERVTGLALPSATPQVGSPEAAICDAAVLDLRSRTRDHARFPLVFSENKSYGFERNLLAVRREGLICASICVAGLTLALLGASAGKATFPLPS